MQIQPTSDLEYFFMFVLKVLDGKEPLPKASACEFWVSPSLYPPWITLSENPSSQVTQSTFVTIRPDDPAVQANFNIAVEHLGPLLARSLMHNIGGNASRSELDKLSDPLKKLVTQHPRSKDWLEAALFGPSFPGSEASQDDKSMFLKKVISLRGARQTNAVVKDFWMTCRGVKYAYTS